MCYLFRKANGGTFSNDDDDDFTLNSNTPPISVSTGTERLVIYTGFDTTSDAVTATTTGDFDVEDSVSTFNTTTVIGWQTDFVGVGAVPVPTYTKVGTNYGMNTIVFF